MKTLREVARELARMDEETVCDLLGLTSEDLVERFMDELEERQDYVRSALDLDDEYDEFDNDEDNY